MSSQAPIQSGLAWIASWTASPQPIWPATFPVAIGFARQLWNQTVRQTARISIGGERLRDRKNTRLNSSHPRLSRMPSSA